MDARRSSGFEPFDPESQTLELLTKFCFSRFSQPTAIQNLMANVNFSSQERPCRQNN